jgi:hypothetical protein
MSRATLDEAFGLVVEETAKKIAKLGFRRRGSILRVVSQGNAGLGCVDKFVDA